MRVTVSEQSTVTTKRMIFSGNLHFTLSTPRVIFQCFTGWLSHWRIDQCVISSHITQVVFTMGCGPSARQFILSSWPIVEYQQDIWPVIQYSTCFHLFTDQWLNLDHWSVCMWKEKKYWVVGQNPTINYTVFRWNNMTNFFNYQILADRFVLNWKMWKNSRYHFSCWYSTVGHEVMRLLLGTRSAFHSEYDPCISVTNIYYHDIADSYPNIWE